MGAIVKIATATVERQGVIQASPSRTLPPVVMAEVPTAWTSSSRTTFPTNGYRYNDFEMAIIAESDQSLWDGMVRGALADLRSIGDGLTPIQMEAERVKLTAWPATYKSWAGI